MLDSGGGRGVSRPASLVGVAQSVELLVVVQVVAGSSPVAHPQEPPGNSGLRDRPPQPAPPVVKLEALLRAVPTDALGRTNVRRPDRRHDGLRQGALIALRWRDVDWVPGRIRVRRSYVRGELGAPKSRRGSRSVPLADRLAGELERHFRASALQDDDDLVFAQPAWQALGCRCELFRNGWGTGDFKSTLIYADCAPGEREAELVELAFGSGSSASLSRVS